MMTVFLDTTETHGDLYLNGAEFTLLQTVLSMRLFSLVVPQIVVEETLAHFRELLRTTLDDHGRSQRALNRLAPSASNVTTAILDCDKATSDYRAALEQRLKVLRAEQPRYDSLALTPLVDRALARRKPFDDKGHVGFRDAVLWETVLEWVTRHSEKAVLVTRNKRDFGQHGQLAATLCEDLTKRGLSSDTVVVCDGMARFTEEYVKPHLAKLDQIAEQIEEGTFAGFDMSAFFADYRTDIECALSEHVAACDFDQITRNTIGDFGSPRLGSLSDELVEAELVDAWYVNENDIAIGVDYTATGTVECLESHYSDPEEGPHHGDFSGDMQFVLSMLVIVNQATGDVVEWKLTDVEMTTGYDWPYPDGD